MLCQFQASLRKVTRLSHGTAYPGTWRDRSWHNQDLVRSLLSMQNRPTPENTQYTSIQSFWKLLKWSLFDSETLKLRIHSKKILKRRQTTMVNKIFPVACYYRTSSLWSLTAFEPTCDLLSLLLEMFPNFLVSVLSHQMGKNACLRTML